MSWLPSDTRMVRRLVMKDWAVYRRQLAGYVGGILFALGLVGSGGPWAMAAGALLLLVLLVVVGSYSIQTSLLVERKQQTVPFIMSLPVTPMDVYWGKLLANLLIYLVPFAAVTGGMAALILLTALPDGLLVYTLLAAVFVLASFCITLCVAIVTASEGWNVFTMLALMTLIGPFLYWLRGVENVGNVLGSDAAAWSAQASGVLLVLLGVIAVAVGLSAWQYARKTVFL